MRLPTSPPPSITTTILTHLPWNDGRGRLFPGTSSGLRATWIHWAWLQHCRWRGWRGDLYLLHPRRRASRPERGAPEGGPDPQCEYSDQTLKSNCRQILSLYGASAASSDLLVHAESRLIYIFISVDQIWFIECRAFWVLEGEYHCL